MSKVTVRRQYHETEGSDYYRTEYLRDAVDGDPDGEFDQYVPALIADELLSVLSAPLWLVWSNEHAAWWGPKQCHYFTDITAAGRYTLEEAMQISITRGGSLKTRQTGNPGEMIQPAPEWIELRSKIIAKTKGEESS